MTRRSALIVLAALGVLLAWLVWPGPGGSPAPPATRRDGAPIGGPRAPALLPAPPSGRPETAPPETAPRTTSPAADGLVECEVRVTTFGDPPRDVRIERVAGLPSVAVAEGSVRVRAKPGDRFGLFLDGAAVSDVRVSVPDPVPVRIDVRVPALDDPRLAEPVLLVVDAASGAPLPGAFLDPAASAPEERPVRADPEGRIRVPRALADLLRASAFFTGGGIVSERDHVPRSWGSLVGMNQGTLADWAEWDARGAMPVRLEPFPSDPAVGRVPRRSLRIVDEEGKPLAASLVLMRTPSMEMLLEPAVPARTDGSGLVEVVAPSVASYDVYDGEHLLGTFVMARDATPDVETREIRVPAAVRVHVVVRGLPASSRHAWLRGPDVVSLDPDDRTGWARIDGDVLPGWKAFTRADGTGIEVPAGSPAEFDVWLPRGRPVALVVGERQAVLRADAPTTIEVDWERLPPPPKEPGSLAWSLTREGLDELSGSGPSVSAPTPGGK